MAKNMQYWRDRFNASESASPFTKKKDDKKKKKTSSDPFAGDRSSEVGPKKPLLEPLPRMVIEKPKLLDRDKYYSRTHDVVENKSDPFAGTRKSYVFKYPTPTPRAIEGIIKPRKKIHRTKIAPPGHYFHTDKSDPFAGNRVKLKKRKEWITPTKKHKEAKIKVKSKKKSNPFG
jgi:hypothetical protein